MSRYELKSKDHRKQLFFVFILDVTVVLILKMIMVKCFEGRNKGVWGVEEMS